MVEGAASEFLRIAPLLVKMSGSNRLSVSSFPAFHIQRLVFDHLNRARARWNFENTSFADNSFKSPTGA